MNILKSFIFAAVVAMLCLSFFAPSCFAQSDDKTRVNLPQVKGAAPADDTKGRVEIKITVPNVVGKKYPDAKQILESAGFTVKATGQVFSKISQRTVTKQTPAGGTVAPRGSVVTCTIQ
jgi:hypothetical protein